MNNAAHLSKVNKVNGKAKPSPLSGRLWSPCTCKRMESIHPQTMHLRLIPWEPISKWLHWEKSNPISFQNMPMNACKTMDWIQNNCCLSGKLFNSHNETRICNFCGFPPGTTVFYTQNTCWYAPTLRVAEKEKQRKGVFLFGFWPPLFCW